MLGYSREICDHRISYVWMYIFFEGKVYGELGLWLKACRRDGHDICQGVGLVQG